MIQDLEPIVVLTGAGISAESGIPTFRGAGGMWEQYRADELATPEAFERDPHLVWQFYDWRRQLVDTCSPNPAHLTLTQLEQNTAAFSIITQNVDGLHLRAGNMNVIELHGSLWDLRCSTCGNKWRNLQVPLPQLPPRCQRCTKIARPDVVWFGERLDESILEKAQNAVMSAQTMLVIGTSDLVQPANLLPFLAQQAGARILEFNLEATPVTPYVDEFIQGPASQVLPAWWGNVHT